MLQRVHIQKEGTNLLAVSLCKRKVYLHTSIFTLYDIRDYSNSSSCREQLLFQILHHPHPGRLVTFRLSFHPTNASFGFWVTDCSVYICLYSQTTLNHSHSNFGITGGWSLILNNNLRTVAFVQPQIEIKVRRLRIVVKFEAFTYSEQQNVAVQLAFAQPQREIKVRRLRIVVNFEAFTYSEQPNVSVQLNYRLRYQSP